MLPAIPWLVQAGIAVIASYGGYVYYDENVKEVEGTFALSRLRFDLNMNIYGQTEALNALIGYLAVGSHHHHAGVIILCGGTGVGKTLALSQIRDNYQPSKMVVSLLQQDLIGHSSSDNAMQRVKKLARVSGVGLVTIDNADISNSRLWDFVKRINEFCQMNRVRVKVVIVAQLFQDVSNSETARNLISNKFGSIDEYVDYVNSKYSNACGQYVNCRVVVFKPISIETLKLCINAAAKSMTGVALKEDQMATLIEQISESGLNYVPGGCKSVQNYVALLMDGI
jgi:hypothetical protein